MAIAHHIGIGKLAAIVYTRVIFAIAQNDVAAPRDGADDPEIGLESGREGHTRLLAEESGKLAFELRMQHERAV